MKKIQIFAILFIIVSSAIWGGTAIFSEPKALIEWQSTSVDFGKIPVGKPVNTEFIFKNSGMVPLIITEVKSSCGCTVADYPKQPIVPGGNGKIKVTYDAKLTGYFSKTISIYSNTEENITELYVKGEVVK